jgi:putative membrane protein insertion efficiency factor
MAQQTTARTGARLAARNLPTLFARGLIRGYQLFLSPVFPASCRFHPTCSEYARDALAEHGIGRGLSLSIWRILRCNPWSRGGHDPVPPACSGHSHDHSHAHGHDHRVSSHPQPHGS